MYIKLAQHRSKMKPTITQYAQHKHGHSIKLGFTRTNIIKVYMGFDSSIKTRMLKDQELIKRALLELLIHSVMKFE